MSCKIVFEAGRRRSEHERPSGLHARMLAHYVDLVGKRIAQPVESHGILLRVDDRRKFCFEHSQTRRVYFDFEHGVLHARAVSLARFGYLSKAPRALGGRYVYIVSYNKQYRYHLQTKAG